MNIRYFLELYESGYRDFTGIHLNGSDLSQHILVEVDLRQANLQGACFSRSFLTQAKFDYANLTRTNLSFAKMSECSLVGADLTKATLRGSFFSPSQSPQSPAQWQRPVPCQLAGRLICPRPICAVPT